MAVNDDDSWEEDAQTALAIHRRVIASVRSRPKPGQGHKGRMVIKARVSKPKRAVYWTVAAIYPSHRCVDTVVCIGRKLEPYNDLSFMFCALFCLLTSLPTRSPYL